ncbi:TFIIB-type zinc ribbon-containing protein [Clostridium sp. DL1XJH146]
MEDFENNVENTEAKKVEETTVTKCPACGSNMLFDPESGNLKCPYCSNKSEIVSEQNNLIENDFEAALENVDNSWGEEKRVFKCENCGAESVIDKDRTAEFCPFCGSSHIVNDDKEVGIKPALVLPFKITKDDALTKFKSWIKGRHFAPNELKKAHKLNKIVGTYIPYWTFDTNTNSNYTVRIGTYYYVEEARWVEEDGKRKRVTERVRKTRWRTEQGYYNHFYDDVLVNASKNVASGLIDSIEPFDLNGLLDYSPNYLSGFLAEKYSISLKDGFEDAKNEINTKIRNGIRGQVFGDEVQIVSVQTDYEDITYKHILLPVWVSSFNFKNKVYRFLVNGQTGKVKGKAPVSAVKVIFLVLTIIIVIAIIILLVG